VKRIVGVLGNDTFEALTNDPTRVLGLLSPEDPLYPVLDVAVLQWRSARGLSDLSIFLQDYDLGPETVEGIFDKFGHEAIDIISKNPYRLIAVEGFSFAKADALASRLGIGRDDVRRLDGAVLWVLRTEARQGHLFTRRGDMPGILQALVAAEHTDPFNTNAGTLYDALMAAVDRLDEQKGVKLDTTSGVYLPDLHLYERDGATKLSKFLTPSEIEMDLDSFLIDYEKSNQIDLSEAQEDAVKKLVQNRVLALTGLPGTGKTTVIRTFVRLFKQTGLSFALMAPTGIAAKRLAAVTGESAGTIHRTLGFNGSSWGYNGRTKYSVNAVIVDEMSMVDQELFFRILDALHPSTMLILVGDDAQLPSVGPGNVLRELISCPQIAHVRLTQIFRQAETSDIVVASHRVNSGRSPLPDVRDPESEFQFVSMSDEATIADLIVEIAAKLKGRNANFQVLAPKYDGGIGVNNLNERLRDKLNPTGPQKEWKAGKLFVREGDRLMVVQNNYNLNVYNGDMGKLVSIEKDHLQVRIHGIGAGSIDTYVAIPKASAPQMLKLAYAITVHKSQGSEFDTVIMPIMPSQGRMLQRNLFYTGLTRAKKKVWLLGDPSSVLKAIANDKVVQRNTAFGRAIVEEVTAGVARALNERPPEQRREEEPVRPADA
jgi:exodeoxyribonuclease V alpha subunit